MEEAGIVSVQFCFSIYDQDEQSDKEECVPEPSSDADLERIRQALPQNEERSGELVITGPDNVEVRIKDSLDALAMQLCFESLPDLIAEKHVVVRHYLMYGYIRLDPEGDLTLISGDYIPKVRVDRAKLISALFHAGERYIQLIKNLRRSDTDYAELLEMLEGYHSDAAQALASATPDQE
jgi:hypothetical protein